MAIISRVLEHAGYRVGIICQPDWTDPASIAALGEPRLGFLISAGNMDSMVNHYTVNKKPRHEDAYTPGGEAGRRPNRAVTVYGNLIRRTYKDKPIIIGGIEASLRRLAHYDYWQDKLKRSVLLDSGADILLYGMGEHSIVEVADALDGGLPVDQITFVNGSAYRTSGAGALDDVFDYELLPSWDELEADRLAYARSFNIQQQNMDPITGGRLVEPYPNGVYVVQNPPSAPLTEREMDEVAELPYARHWHPDYDAAGGIPAFDEIRFSISSNRGCFGECSFCALAFHQGRMVQVRSRESIIREAEALTHDPEFKGYINDVGGPTANFFKPACKKQLTHGVCKNRRCLWPDVCRNMDTNEDAYADLLRDLRQIPGVKKVFVRSGIRFDYTMADASDKFLVELLQHHVSGQLRLAPEHVSDAVLSVMGKPRREVYDAFVERFERLSAEYGLKQYVVPYLISSHPGSTMKEAVELAEAVRDMGYMPEQVQDFYPTPSTMSTCMFYTGVDPRTMRPVYIPRDPHEKAMQRALIQYRKPENYKLVKEALRKAGREDLIGYGAKCLIRPVPPKPGAGGGKAGAKAANAAERPRNDTGAASPTPSTMSTCMFYTGVDPRTMRPVYIPRDPHEKAMQRALIQYRKPENYKLVKEALRKAGREDLIGYGAKCLIRPVPPKPGAGGGKAGAKAANAAERPRNDTGAASRPQNRAERRAAARSGKKGATPSNGRMGAKQAARPSHGKPDGRATGKSAAGTNPHARNRAAQGRQGANRH